MPVSGISLEECLNLKALPSYDFIFSLADKACKVLLKENVSYRPQNCLGEPGSLLELPDLPAVLVPDIHARPDFIKNILACKLPSDFCGEELTVEQALKNKIINLICVGDAVHSELYSERWGLISLEFEKGEYAGLYMQEEMLLNISVVASLMKLKTLYPENFHFLKGNHENILNSNLGGDYAFFKYADEGEMVKAFMLKQYDEKLLNKIAKYENSLPLLAYGSNYVVSHAEPAGAYSREELIDAKFEEGVVEGLIWTRNGQVTEPTALAIMNKLLGKKEAKKSLYFAGHRPVRGTYNLRQDGRLVQIHNPRAQNIFLVDNKRKFDFSKDIINTKTKLIKKGEAGKDGR